MQKRRKQYGRKQFVTMAAVIVSFALLTAPLCSAACAGADLFASLGTQTVKPDQPHHCHQSPAQRHQSPAQPSNPASPQPEKHSHNCENHQTALLLSGKGSLSVLNCEALGQPYLPASFVSWLTGHTQVRYSGWQDLLKAPPRSQLRRILRI